MYSVHGFESNVDPDFQYDADGTVENPAEGSRLFFISNLQFLFCIQLSS